MSSTPDPRYGAVIEILTRFMLAPDTAQVGPYVDELLASIDSIHAFEDRPQPQSADDAHLRVQALESAMRGSEPRLETPQAALARAEVFLAFLRGEQTAGPRAYPFIDGPTLVLGPEIFTGDGVEFPQTVISWKGENFYTRDAWPGAPAALHEAIDRAWGSIRDMREYQTMLDEDDEDVLEQLRQLGDDEIVRSGFTLGIVRSLSMIVRGDRLRTHAAAAEGDTEAERDR